jgi:hypothetical protein
MRSANGQAIADKLNSLAIQTNAAKTVAKTANDAPLVVEESPLPSPKPSPKLAARGSLPSLFEDAHLDLVGKARAKLAQTSEGSIMLPKSPTLLREPSDGVIPKLLPTSCCSPKIVPSPQVLRQPSTSIMPESPKSIPGISREPSGGISREPSAGFCLNSSAASPLTALGKDLVEKKRQYAQLKDQLDALAYEIHTEEELVVEFSLNAEKQAMMSVDAFDRIGSSHF